MAQVLPLRNKRLTRGWSLDDVARRLVELGREAGEDNLGVNGLMVGRWERGERRPAPPYPKLLCVLYQATAWELGIVEGSHNPEPSGRLVDVDRREVLHLLSLALMAPVLLRGESGADRLAYALAKPSRADLEAVSLVESAIAHARRLDDVAGTRVAVRPALAQREVIRILLEGRPPEPVAERLTVAAAELSQLLGFLSRGLRDHAMSRRYYGEALQFAHEAGDEALGAYVLGQLSILVTVGGGPRGSVRSGEASMDSLHEGLAFAQAATSRAQEKGSAATRSWLATVEAEALCNLGDPAGTDRALDRARTSFARFRAEDEPPWMYYYDQGYQEGHFGLVYLALGRSAPARRATELAIEALDDSMVRDRACHVARLAQTYVADGEVHEACRLAGEALAGAEKTKCDGPVLRVRRMRGQLEPWASEPMVRELDDQLASTASWFHPAST